ncbi:MAG TPA: 4Fe-4S binding protein, partial [Firmicutes bacterium]|nr:4Fe-4S binding protein [Bacillota bacterium]
DSFGLKALEQALKEELPAREPSVIVARRPCALMQKPGIPFYCDTDLCNDCGLCLRLGCPALSRAGGKAVVDVTLCTGCTLCGQVCPRGALKKAVKDDEA